MQSCTVTLNLERDEAWVDRSAFGIPTDLMSPFTFSGGLLGDPEPFAHEGYLEGNEFQGDNPVFHFPDTVLDPIIMGDLDGDHVHGVEDRMLGVQFEPPAATTQPMPAFPSSLGVSAFSRTRSPAASECLRSPAAAGRSLAKPHRYSGLTGLQTGNWRNPGVESVSGSSVSPVDQSYTPTSTQVENVSPNGDPNVDFDEDDDHSYSGLSPTSTTRTGDSFVIISRVGSSARMSNLPHYSAAGSGASRGSPVAPSSSSTTTTVAAQWGSFTTSTEWMGSHGPDPFHLAGTYSTYTDTAYATADQLGRELLSDAGPFDNAAATNQALPFRGIEEYNYDMVGSTYRTGPQYLPTFPQVQPQQQQQQQQHYYPAQLQVQHYTPTAEQQRQAFLTAQQQHRMRHMPQNNPPRIDTLAQQQQTAAHTAPPDMGHVHMTTFPMQPTPSSSQRSTQKASTSRTATSQSRSRQHMHRPEGSQSSSESSSTSRASKKSFHPIVKAEPGSASVNLLQIPQQAGRRGGRQRGTNLPEQARQKSSKMRKVTACWRCALQRDPCDDGTPCGRCSMKLQKGQTYFFDCDRSKLPEFVKEFLPPTMTLMHEQQTIEDTVNDQVIEWNTQHGIDVYLTSGYGPPLIWKLYEFRPKSKELLGQLQYFQDPSTGRSRGWYKYSPPFGLLQLDRNDESHVEEYLDSLMNEDWLLDLGWTFYEEETQVDPDAFQANLLDFICTLYRHTEDEELRDLLRQIIRMMIVTYIMGHTLTISEETLPTVLAKLRFNPAQPGAAQMRHISPRLANRQLKFFFSMFRTNIYGKILQWQQQTLHTSGKKEGSWLTSFCAMLGFAMVLEEIQRTLQIQADAKVAKQEMTADLANKEANSACERIDKRFKLLVGLFQCKYRDKKWGEGSFGPQTPKLQGRAENQFLKSLRELLVDKAEHLKRRQYVQCLPENQCLYTSRLVARFLLPFLGLPP